MATKDHKCGICENANPPSVCAVCVNLILNEKYKLLNTLQRDRDSLHKRLDEKLKAKHEAVEQQHWRLTNAKKIAQLKQTLDLKKKQFLQEKSDLEEKTKEFNTRKSSLDEAYAVLKTNESKRLKLHSDLIRTQSSRLTAIREELFQNQFVVIKQLCKVFPLRRCVRKPNEGESKDEESSGEDYYYQICNVSLPRGTDPKSVTPKELAVSLGYMVQLLKLVARYLNAPLLLDSDFAGSSSRVWRRATYWDSRPVAFDCSRLFLPNQNYSEYASKSECSINLDLASPDVVMEVQKGIYLLKKAVASVTAYYLNTHSIPLPTELSTFEAFEKMLAFVSSKDKVAATILFSEDCKETKPRNRSQERQNPMTSTLLYSNEISDQSRTAAEGFEGWEVVPTPPSNPEDFEQWIREMISHDAEE